MSKDPNKEHDNLFRETYYKVTLRYKDTRNWIEICQWCDASFGRENYLLDINTFWFKNEKDVFLFTLKWDG